ncbi:MAG: type II secretion system protein GspD [Lentisphaerae bacterium]|jgi:type II secretory pathway component GspD/PulD (secretin)|nr:type II secretion system protein GspD [Lentisphaerota bacterium]
MRFFSSFAAVVMFMLVLSSCKTTPEQEYEFYESEEAALEAIKRDEQREFETGVRKRLDLVQGLIDKGEYDDALGLLDPLKRFDFCRTEVLALEKTIEIMSRKGARAIGEKHTEVTMVTQSDTELTLPSTYGTTVMIDSQLSPIELPKGSQEDLINKKISLSLESADVAQLVEELNANGLNVIADDALQSDKTLTVKFKDVPIKELFAYIARNMGVAFYVGENMVWVTEGETGGGPKLETRIIRLPHGFVPEVPQGGGAPGAQMGSGGNIPTEEDNDLEDVLTSFLNDSPEGAGFKIFRNRNIIVVRDTRENLRFVEELIREFDKPPMQVAIEARFITVSQKDLKDVGVELSQMQIPVDAAGNALGPLANVPNYTNRFAAEGIRALSSGATFGEVETESGMGQVTLNGVLGNRIFDVVIRMIETKRSAVSLSVPRVTVMNNRTARIRKGDKLYYFEEYDTATIDKGDQGEQQTLVPTGSPTELPVGITLDVRVNIGNNGKSILMGLKPEVVNFIQWESYSYVNSDDDDDDDDDSTMAQIKLPRTHEQMIATTVGVESGETVVLGGLLENSKSKEVRKIPFLGDLPLIGFLFRRTIRNVEPTNLLIFVTARVINERGEYVKVIDKEDAEAGASVSPKAGAPAKPVPAKKPDAPVKAALPAKEGK